VFGDNRPVIMLTSYKSAEVAVECFEGGSDDFIQKPCALKELIARIQSKTIPLRNNLSFGLDKKLLGAEGKIDLG
jgi:DNA-binding response OmpR family regulator